MPKRPGSAGDPLWYKDAVIYELHVRAFKDSNGHGIGDFPGLIQRLDYLQDLGVTSLSLLPFFPSPLKNNGYDISDYMNVHSMYGTMDDFKAFLAAAHERDLQLMIELVVNHTSDAARQSPAAPERDFYLWSDTDQKYKDARIIFSDTERYVEFPPSSVTLIGSNWHLTVFSGWSCNEERSPLGARWI
jgi:maltose alpha-D-glucosyltransferase/alpha-amylase